MPYLNAEAFNGNPAKKTVKNIICLGETDYAVIAWNDNLRQTVLNKIGTNSKSQLVNKLGYYLSNERLEREIYASVTESLGCYAAQCQTPNLSNADYAAVFALEVGRNKFATQWVGCFNADSDAEAMKKAYSGLIMMCSMNKSKLKPLKGSKTIKAMRKAGVLS